MNSGNRLIKSPKVYKEVYIQPTDKHKGFYRKYLENPDSDKLAKIAARAEAGGALSKIYKLYLNFIQMLEKHGITKQSSKKSQAKLMEYKAKLIKARVLAKLNPLPTPIFAFSDYTYRRLDETRMLTEQSVKSDADGKPQMISTRFLWYPAEKSKNPEDRKKNDFNLSRNKKVEEFTNKHLVEPLKALSGKIKDCRGLDLKILGPNPEHFYQRAEFRISQYVEQYITEKHYHDLRMILKYDIRDPDAPESIKAEFETFRKEFEQHIKDDIDANADAMAKELCEKLVDTVKNPLWIKEGNNDTKFSDPRMEGTTEFHSKDFTVVIAHSGTIMTFWPNSAGERFAIDQGWRGATKKPKPKSKDDIVPPSQWQPSSSWMSFVNKFDWRNFEAGYYPQPALRQRVFNIIQNSYQSTYHPSILIKKFEYSQYNATQLLEIAKKHNITIPKNTKTAEEIIDVLVDNTPDDIVLDMKGKYIIPPMTKYDATVFTDRDFNPNPQRNTTSQKINNPQRSQKTNKPRRNDNPQRGLSDLGAKLLAIRDKFT